MAERWRNSLFAVPTAFVAGGLALGMAGIAIDARIGDAGRRLPFGVASTVESARAVLSTIASGTITVAGIAFSISILTIQLASSQYSPRVVTNLFRDPFNKRVIGLVVGTFSYCLIVLRSVRSPLDQQGTAVIPNLSVALAVLLGISAILATIAFINHNAHAMDISKILDVVTHDAVEVVRDHWATSPFEASPLQRPDDVPPGTGFVVVAERDGWIQLFDHGTLLEATPHGATVRLDTAVGRYVCTGSPLCTVWPAPPRTTADETSRRIRAALHIGETRTLRQDATFGVRQIADVALKALSPGVNDPTTAQDAIFHLVAVLRAFLSQDPPAADLRDGDRRLVLARVDSHADVVALAYSEIRRAAASQPAVCVYLLQSFSLLLESLPTERRQVAEPLLVGEAERVMCACERADVAGTELEPLREIYAQKFVAHPVSAATPSGA